jgi:signal transduction histidine kinase/ActR/RegA family two-component response regulator
MTPTRAQFTSALMLTGSRLERMLGVVRSAALPVEARATGEAMLGGEAVSRRLAATVGGGAHRGRVMPTEAEDDVTSAVYAEQVRSLFKQIPIALSVNFVNAALVAIVLTPLATRPLPLPWFISVMLVTIGRGILWLRYRQAPVQPENAPRWSRLATWGSLLSGLSWGIGGIILFPVLPAPGQLFLIIVMGGMCAGAMAMSASHLPSFLAFLLPTGLPMALLFYARGSTTDSVLAAMIVVFVAALSLAGRHFSQILAEALRLRFELNEANLRLTKANLRLQAEIAERRATEAALRQAQKLEAMGHLTGGIAHDFNNLLTVVVGNARLLCDRAADEPTRRRAAAILSIADRGERLIRQLLTFSRRRMLRPEAVALQGRTSEIAELLARSLREDIAVMIDLPADVWPVTVDLGEFELALLNIAVNARNAMPNGGAFRLVARNTRSGGETASGGLVGEFVAITLTDTGTGMRAEVMARAFEPYFTTMPAGLGSGLGLSQVYGFASQSGGSAVLASAPGEGTAITLFLPRADLGPAMAGESPAMAGEIAAQPAFDPGAARILLVEDDPGVAEATQDLLHNMGFDTRWAGDGPAALALVENDPKLALVVSDVVMPGGVSGLDLARTLRDRRPELPVILVTGYSSHASQVVAEGFALVEKPYRRDVLAASIRSALQNRGPSVSETLTSF